MYSSGALSAFPLLCDHHLHHLQNFSIFPKQSSGSKGPFVLTAPWGEPLSLLCLFLTSCSCHCPSFQIPPCGSNSSRWTAPRCLHGGLFSTPNRSLTCHPGHGGRGGRLPPGLPPVRSGQKRPPEAESQTIRCPRERQRRRPSPPDLGTSCSVILLQASGMLVEVSKTASRCWDTLLSPGAKVFPVTYPSGLLKWFYFSNRKNCRHFYAFFLGSTSLKGGRYLPLDMPFLIKMFSSCFCFQAHNVKHTN